MNSEEILKLIQKNKFRDKLVQPVNRKNIKVNFLQNIWSFLDYPWNLELLNSFKSQLIN